MSRFCVDLRNSCETLSLEFEVLSTSIAQRWFCELQSQLARRPDLQEDNRLYNFANGPSKQELVDRLNAAIDDINAWRQIVPVKMQTPSKPMLNMMHMYFEQMRGGILNPTPYWLLAPSDIQKRIQDFNVLIHWLENLDRNLKFMVITFPEKVRQNLLDDDYKEFSTDTKFGTVYINYCEVGKPLFDVFDDRDDVVSAENIRPLRYYSADMSIFFSNAACDMVGFWKWWDQNSDYLTGLGFVKHDPKLSLGKIPVARLISEMNTDTISRFSRISGVRAE